jgi:hypothetical protein
MSSSLSAMVIILFVVSSLQQRRIGLLILLLVTAACSDCAMWSCRWKDNSNDSSNGSGRPRPVPRRHDRNRQSRSAWRACGQNGSPAAMVAPAAARMTAASTLVRPCRAQ